MPKTDKRARRKPIQRPGSIRGSVDLSFIADDYTVMAGLTNRTSGLSVDVKFTVKELSNVLRNHFHDGDSQYFDRVARWGVAIMEGLVLGVAPTDELAELLINHFAVKQGPVI